MDPGLPKDGEVSLSAKMKFKPSVANDDEDFDNFAIYSHLQVKDKTGLIHGFTEFFSTETGVHYKFYRELWFEPIPSL